MKQGVNSFNRDTMLQSVNSTISSLTSVLSRLENLDLASPSAKMESAISVIKERLDKSHSLKKQLERMQNDYTARSSASIKQETDEEIFEKVLKETALLINENRDDLKVLLEILRLLRKLPSEKSR